LLGHGYGGWATATGTGPRLRGWGHGQGAGAGARAEGVCTDRRKSEAQTHSEGELSRILRQARIKPLPLRHHRGIVLQGHRVRSHGVRLLRDLKLGRLLVRSRYRHGYDRLNCRNLLDLYGRQLGFIPLFLPHEASPAARGSGKLG
jgi:hypothetical protein